MAKRRPRRRAAVSDEIRNAMSFGREQADAAVSRRALAARQRAAALASTAPARRGHGRPAPPAPARTTAGVLVAEGDSWFDYPLADVLRILEDAYGYDVESVAYKGDRVEDMAYARGQLDAFTRQIDKLLRRSVVPKAILLSGGGNDVAGDGFGVLLNHEQLGHALPILLHGYDYPVPDGRGFFGGSWVLPGPWLEPGFRAKGYGDPAERLRMTAELIDRFNEMLEGVVALPGLGHVRHLDLRGTLSSDPASYKKDWANELHPTIRGWRLVADRFARALGALS